jgi:hypothetical protein
MLMPFWEVFSYCQKLKKPAQYWATEQYWPISQNPSGHTARGEYVSAFEKLKVLKSKVFLSTNVISLHACARFDIMYGQLSRLIYIHKVIALDFKIIAKIFGEKWPKSPRG